MDIRWSPRARAHLRHVHDYIAQDNPKAAVDVVARILEAVEKLQDYPASGRHGRVPHTRELVIQGTPFFIAYRVRKATLEIIVVLHQARKWPRG